MIWSLPVIKVKFTRHNCWMRFPLAALILLAASLGAAQAPTRADLQGKTPAQVVAMGRDKWFTYFTGKVGDSTAAMSGAESLYGACLKISNDKVITRLPKEKREQIGRLRYQLNRFNDEVVRLGEILTGGGTMWNPVYAGILADNEEAVAVLIGKAKPRKTGSSPEEAISFLDRYLDKVAPDIKEWGETEYRSVAKAKAKVALLRSTLKELEATAAKIHPSGREWIRHEAARSATSVQSMTGDV